MATQASTFENLVITGEMTHVQGVEKHIDSILEDKNTAHLAVLNTKMVDDSANGGFDKCYKGVKIEVFMKISDEEIEELKQLYVDAGWRNVNIRRLLGTKTVEAGFIFEADFA